MFLGICFLRIFRSGAGKLNLEEPRVVRVDYKVLWKRVKIDLVELAKLRQSGLKIREIATTLGIGKSTVQENLRCLRRGK